MDKRIKKHLKAEGSYKFKALNLSDYELITTLKVKGRLIELMFNKAKSAFYKMKKININGNPQDITRFKVTEEKYFSLYKVALKNQINTIFNRMKAKGIHVLYEDVKECEFIRDENNDWTIQITFEGQYIDKR